MTTPDWTPRFEGTKNLPASVRTRLQSVTELRRVPAGTLVFAPGHAPDSLLLLYSGRMRVSQTSEGGREIVLYRIDAGESCVLTTACMLFEEAYTAEGIAETDVELVVLPQTHFESLIAQEPSFRKFVMSAYSRRLIDLMRVVDDVAFGRLDVRLAERLLELASGGTHIATTHQALATELGTAREVISRVLNDFQKRGLIESGRGRITLLDPAGLSRLKD